MYGIEHHVLQILDERKHNFERVEIMQTAE